MVPGCLVATNASPPWRPASWQTGLFHLTFAWNSAKLHQYTLHGNFCPIYIKGALVIFWQCLGPLSPYCWVSERKNPLIPTPSPSQVLGASFQSAWFWSRWDSTARREGNKTLLPWGTSHLVGGWGSRRGILEEEADRACRAAMLSSKKLQKLVACHSGASGNFPVSKISLLLMSQ